MTTVAAALPISRAFDASGIMLANGLLYTSAAGSDFATSPLSTYADNAGTPNANPVQLDGTGTQTIRYAPGVGYKLVLKDSAGTTTLWTLDNYFAPPASQADLVTVLGADPIVRRTAAEITAGLTPVNLTYPVTTPIDLRRYVALVTDSTTDNTTAITTFWTAAATYRASISIPYGTKFTKASVYSAMPVGILLVDNSSINTGQPPGYKNKSIIYYTNDTASDDTQNGINSAHHPSLRLNNLHTAGSASATGGYHSILFGYGFRWNNDAIDLMQYLTFLGPRGTAPIPLTRSAWVVNTRAQAATKSTHWLASTVYATGSIVDTSNSGVWINNGASGTTASTEPTGTGPTFTDGTVTWTYLYAWSVGVSVMYVDEDGYGACAGTTTARWGAETSNRKGISINSNDTTHDVWIADDQKVVDLWRLSDANGLRHGGIRSLNYAGAISGATPTITGELHAVTNGSATNMTNILMSGSQTCGYVILQFTNGNTTVKASGFNLKGGIDVTPVSGNIMTLYKDPSFSSSWTEISRNF